jgi:hypothetical protein
MVASSKGKARGRDTALNRITRMVCRGVTNAHGPTGGDPEMEENNRSEGCQGRERASIETVVATNATNRLSRLGHRRLPRCTKQSHCHPLLEHFQHP